jgi:hypothetical protein
VDQVVQIVGAVLILIAYAAAQLGAMDQHSRASPGACSSSREAEFRRPGTDSSNFPSCLSMLKR